MRLALSADACSESITSDTAGGGGGGAAGSVELGLALEPLVSLVEETSLPAARATSVASARACAARWAATTANAAVTCGGLPTAPAAAEASALSRRACSSGPSSSSTAGGLGVGSLQADTNPSAARAAPPASTPRLLMTVEALGTPNILPSAGPATEVGTIGRDLPKMPYRPHRTMPTTITASIVNPGVSWIAGYPGRCRRASCPDNSR